MRRHLPPITLVVLGLFACSSDEQGSVGADDAASDASASEDVFFPEVSNDGTTPSGQDSGLGVDGADGTQAGPPDGDASEGPCNTFGCACSSNADCLDELCVEGPDGRVCSSPCVTECPEEGYACVPIVLSARTRSTPACRSTPTSASRAARTASARTSCSPTPPRCACRPPTRMTAASARARAPAARRAPTATPAPTSRSRAAAAPSSASRPTAAVSAARHGPT